MNTTLFSQSLWIVNFQNPRILGRSLEVQLRFDVNPRNLINLSPNRIVQLSFEVDLTWMGVSLTSPHLEHAAIDGRNIDVEVAAVSSDRVICKTVEFLEVLLLHYEETFTIPKRLGIVVLACGFLRNIGKEIIE